MSTWPAVGSVKIWILVPDWFKFKSSEPNANHVTRKIGPLHFKTTIVKKLRKSKNFCFTSRYMTCMNLCSWKRLENCTHPEKLYYKTLLLKVIWLRSTNYAPLALKKDSKWKHNISGLSVIAQKIRVVGTYFF